MKKFYTLLESNIGIVLLFVVYFFLRIPTDFNPTAIRFSIGASLGALIAPAMLILVLSRRYQWDKRQKLLRVGLLGLLYMFLMEIKPLLFLFNLFNALIAALFILIVLWEVIIHLVTPKSKNVSNEDKYV